jgi:hypothetical protein
MIASEFNSRINYYVVLATALLISNVVAISCAVAFPINSECAQPPDSQCIEMCSAEEAVATDKFPDGTSDPRPPIMSGDALLPTNLNFASANINGTKCDVNLHNPSPPLNLLYCVFLK